jgi:hypothetical protein
VVFNVVFGEHVLDLGHQHLHHSLGIVPILAKHFVNTQLSQRRL